MPVISGCDQQDVACARRGQDNDIVRTHTSSPHFKSNRAAAAAATAAAAVSNHQFADIVGALFTGVAVLGRIWTGVRIAILVYTWYDEIFDFEDNKNVTEVSQKNAIWGDIFHHRLTAEDFFFWLQNKKSRERYLAQRVVPTLDTGVQSRKFVTKKNRKPGCDKR